MLWILATALFLTLLTLLARRSAERRQCRELADSVRSRAPHLTDEPPAGGHWHNLITAVNQLQEEASALRSTRDGQLTQLRTVLNALSEAVIITDEGARVLLANDTARRLLASNGEITGTRLQRLLPASEVVAMIEDLRRGKKPAATEVRMGDEPKSLLLSLDGSLLPGGDRSEAAPWALFVLNDLTRQRELEGHQKELIGNVSHELRTPISVIRGYAETLADDHERLPPADRDRFIQAIRRHSLRLSSLVEDLLTLGRLESKYPGLEYEHLDLHAAIGELEPDFSARARATGHNLVLELDAAQSRVRADAFRLTQVLENLVENALKYSGANSTIRIRTKSVDGAIQVGVEDNGPGIPQKDVARIFERFYRVEKARSRDKGGTGLGLTIVREIVELHGGRVWVDSVEGRGSCFWFSLPLRKDADAAPAQVP